jgi:hypothetical protein
MRRRDALAAARSGGRALRLASILMALTLAACGSVTRRAATALPAVEPVSGEHGAFRFASGDAAAFDRFLNTWHADMAQAGRDGVVALGLSGGGSGGAFGAGVLLGWTGEVRPDFNLVTGVSTGAMIAPFAFAGPEWNAALRAAFFDPAVEGLTSAGLGVLRRPSLYSGIPLFRLVARHATTELIATVARRHREGRRLLIATTYLDSLETMIWDMGAIAVAAQDRQNGARAEALFRAVIVASASAPGYFPPVVLSVAGRPELHIDGAVNSPVLLLPEAVALREVTGRLRPLQLYVLINARVAPAGQAVGGGTLAVLGQALDSMGRANLRTQLQLIELFAWRHRAELHVAAMPPELEMSPFNFDAACMQRMFDLGYAAAASGHAFAGPEQSQRKPAAADGRLEAAGSCAPVPGPP